MPPPIFPIELLFCSRPPWGGLLLIFITPGSRRTMRFGGLFCFTTGLDPALPAVLTGMVTILPAPLLPEAVVLVPGAGSVTIFFGADDGISVGCFGMTPEGI